MFVNVAGTWIRQFGRLRRVFNSNKASGVVVIRGGKLVCAAEGTICADYRAVSEAHFVDLEGGVVGPGFASAGSSLGLQEIAMEASTTDGIVFDPLLRPVPSILGGDYTLVRAVDGLQFATRDALCVCTLASSEMQTF